jgi:hypothetical protein
MKQRLNLQELQPCNSITLWPPLTCFCPRHEHTRHSDPPANNPEKQTYRVRHDGSAEYSSNFRLLLPQCPQMRKPHHNYKLHIAMHTHGRATSYNSCHCLLTLCTIPPPWRMASLQTKVPDSATWLREAISAPRSQADGALGGTRHQQVPEAVKCGREPPQVWQRHRHDQTLPQPSQLRVALPHLPASTENGVLNRLCKARMQ